MGVGKCVRTILEFRQLWPPRLMGLALLVLAGSFVNAAFAQTATGTLTGTITDPKGLAMAGVNVVVHSADTSADQKPALTNDSGVFLVPLLPPGTYDITASQTGFATVQHKAVTLQVGQTIRVDIEMPVQSQQSLVTVTTEIPLLETEKTELSTNVSENLVSSLPVSSRRWEQFAFLTPGVNPDGATGGISFHGLNSMYNNNSVDGANNTNSYNAGARGGTNDGYVYSGDSIREFQVSSSGFSAELGQAAGGSVNAVTKSGTSQFHGDLFYNGRAANFNAVDPVAKINAASSGTPATQSVHQQHQWGGSLGGPLIKDKLFFFFTDDGYRKVNPQTVTTNQLSPSIKALTCPTLTAAGVTAGATVPTAAQCQAAKDFIFAHFIGEFRRSLRQDIELVKLDYQLNQSNHLNVVANIRDWKQPADPALLNGGSTSYIQDRFIIANWTTVISNTKVNELRYQWGQDHSFSGRNTATGAPQVALSNLFTYGDASGSGYNNEHRNQISDNFSITRGTHQIKFGVDINLIHEQPRSGNNSAGVYSYSNAVSLGANISCVAPTGFSSAQNPNTTFCDWLMDLFAKDAKETPLKPVVLTGARFGQHWATFNQFKDNVEVGYPESYAYDFENRDYGGYIQDNWKMRSNLTVNYGIRYDVQLLPPLKNSVTQVFGAAASLPILDLYTTRLPNEYDAIQPRLGIAWNFRKTSVVRVGGGLYFAKTAGSTMKNIFSGAGETTTQCATPVVLTGSGVNCPVNLIFPNLFFKQQDTEPWTLPLAGAPLPVVLNPPVTVPNPKFGIRGMDPNAVRPRAYQFQAAFEQQLIGGMNLSVSYVFTRGVHLQRGGDVNVAPTTINKTYDVVALDSSGAGVTQLTSTVPLFYSRIEPKTGVIPAQITDVNSTYNGMVVTLRKPMSYGFEVLANYTLSRSTDDGQQGLNIGALGNITTDGNLDLYNLHFDQGYSSTDSRNRFTTSVIWAPAFGRNFNGAKRQLAAGWSLAATMLATNGTRYGGTVSSTSSPSVTIAGVTYTGLDGGMTGALVQSNGSNIGGRIAWLPRNSFVLPNLFNVDLRLTKQFNITERFRFELRGEAFNLLNSTLVQAVSTNAYTYTQPAAPSSTNLNPPCWNGTGVMPAGTPVHTNTCMTPVATFQKLSTTTGSVLGPRQLQAGIRFEF